MTLFDILLYNSEVKKHVLIVLVLIFGLALICPNLISDVQATNSAYIVCEQIPNSLPQKGACQTCAGSIDGEPQGMWTAIGCVPTNIQNMMKIAIYLGISISGGIGMVSLITAGFLYSISSGDPKRTTQAQELMTSTVIGLLFIIFSVTILKFIGSDLMKIPGFGS